MGAHPERAKQVLGFSQGVGWFALRGAVPGILGRQRHVVAEALQAQHEVVVDAAPVRHLDEADAV